MNRNNKYNRSQDIHYGDLDQSGNRRSGGNPDYTYYPDRDDFSEPGNSLKRQAPSGGFYGRTSNGTRAFGDYSGGTRYGEGGSTSGGGSSYGHSSYGLSGQRGSGDSGFDRNRTESRRTASGRFADSDSRNRGSYGGSNEYNDFVNHNYGPVKSSGSSSPYGRDTSRDNTGYDRGYSGYGRTGYGSTSYNNRDVDREHRAYGSQSQSRYNRYEADSDRGGYTNRDLNY